HFALGTLHSALLLSSRYLGRRRLRTLLVVASIALGVATLVATRALNASLGKAAEGAVTPWSAASDLVGLNGQAGVPAEAVRKIADAGLAEVREVQPVVLVRVALPDLGNRPVLLLGVDPSLATRGGDNPWGVTVEWRGGASRLWAAALTGRRPAL